MLYSACIGGRDAPSWVDRLFTAQRYFATPRHAARCYKILSHLWLPEAACSVWLDANCQPLADTATIEADLLGDEYDVACFTHPLRTRVAEEAKVIAAAGLDEHFDLASYLHLYRDCNSRLVESGILARRHTPAVQAFNATWWALWTRWSVRDQLTLPIALDMHPNLRVRYLDIDVHDYPLVHWVAHAGPYQPCNA